MERYSMFLDWENGHTTQSNLQIHCNPYPITHDIFHRTRANNSNIYMEPQKTQNRQSNPEFAISHITLSLPQSIQWCCGVISLDTDTFPGFPPESPVLDPIPTSATPLSTLLSELSFSRPHWTAADILYMDETSQ